jgi:hypothetical protein
MEILAKCEKPLLTNYGKFVHFCNGMLVSEGKKIFYGMFYFLLAPGLPEVSELDLTGRHHSLLVIDDLSDLLLNSKKYCEGKSFLRIDRIDV